MPRFLSFAVAFALLSFFAGGTQAQTPAQAGDGSGSAVFVTYSAKSDQTVAMVNLVLPGIGEQTVDVPNLSFMAVFPGKYVVRKPSWVDLNHVSSNTTGYIYPAKPPLSFLLDGKTVDLGELAVTDRLTTKAEPPVAKNSYREIVNRHVPVAAFLQLVAARSVTIQMGPEKIELTPEQLKTLVDFAELIQDNGRKLQPSIPQ
jgi:hypothetical protein